MILDDQPHDLRRALLAPGGGPPLALPGIGDVLGAMSRFLHAQAPKPTPIDADPRRAASMEAFKQVFGHAPVDNVDWETAYALNPNSYDPKYLGVKPQIRVVRINPVAEQGVVRAGAFIHVPKAFNSVTGDDNLGDDRDPQADFDPEHTRVSMYVDYKNGLVVLRQNPSVKLDSDGKPAEAKTGTPEAQVWQAQDGSVRIKYSAHDAFVPSLGPTIGTVNGDLVFTPGHGVAGTAGSTGATVNGRTTEYPWLEIYQDAPNGNRHTIGVMRPPERIDNRAGPNLGLWVDHDVGEGLSATAPFQERGIVQKGPDNFQYAMVDKPSVNAGSVQNPPKAPVYASGGDVRGPGSSIGDKIPAWLSDGEFVMNAKSTEVNRQFLQALNQDPYFLQKMLAQAAGGGGRASGGGAPGPVAQPDRPALVNISTAGGEDVIGRLKVLAAQWELMHAR
ncbi:hypothetical protein [Nocardia pseudobrasiliensis]|uniref:Uncharacterized protein n=1 Tax=Nocardia pseudobrasiliensis TaxID=45979 RepID=A0A370HXI8_9NOCA|nr:hypothetical protein [Nocardia pseudobrasiliensis]RDI63226.1 hypothetical protein DFR76_111245 [Nocardia pseudobrasiliensis]